MVTTLVTLRDNDEELANVVIATGPGDGINRPMVTVRDADSIAQYGARETAQTFESAVDIADLTAKARTYLDAHKEPRQQLEVELAPENDEDIAVGIGTTVRVVDPRSSTVVIAEVLEYEWADGIVRAWLGRTAPNIIDSVTRALEPDRDNERLGLPPPIGLRVQRLQPGILVFVNPFVGSRAQGVEIHASTVPNFEATRATQRARGSSTRFELADLTPGVRYYLKARSYDARGEVGELTDEVSIVSGVVDTALDPNIQEDIDNAAAQAAVVAANADVWDRAQAIQADLTILTSRLAGVIERVQLAAAVQADILTGVQAAADVATVAADLNTVETDLAAVTADANQTATDVTDIITTLNSNPDAVGQYAAITQNNQQFQSIVATLNDSPDAPSQFTAISQNSTGISLVAAEFEPFAMSDDAGDIMLTESGDVIISEQQQGEDTLGVTGSYAAIEIESDRITNTVGLLGNPNDPASAVGSAFSRISQTGTEIRSVVANLNGPAATNEYSSIAQNAQGITSTVGRVNDVEATLNSGAQAVGQYSSISQTADGLDTVVANLNGPAGTSAYSSIAQNAAGVTTTVGRVDNVEATLNGDPQAVGQYSAVKQTADGLESVVTNLNGPAGGNTYSSIAQNEASITSTVATLNADNTAVGQFSSIRQTADGLESVVVKLGTAPGDPNQFSSIAQNAAGITSTVAQVNNVEAVLNGSATAVGQYSSISQTATELTSTVAQLNAAADDPNQFTSIAQNASGISLVAAEFEPFAMSDDAGDIMLTESGDRIVSDQNLAEDTLGIVGAFARIDLESDRITNTVSLLGNPNDPGSPVGTAFSRINQTVGEIDLRVREDEIVSSINLSTEGVRISADKIQLNGDVAVTGNVAITDSASGAHRLESRDFGNNLKAAFGNITGLDGVPAAPFGGDTFGLWGELGTGIFIKGVPKIVATGLIKNSVAYPSVSGGLASRIVTGLASGLGLSNAPSSYTVASDRALLIIGAMIEEPISPSLTAQKRVYFQFGATYDGGSGNVNSAITSPFPGGRTYANFGATVVSDLIMVVDGSLASSTGAFTLQYLMLDIPA